MINIVLNYLIKLYILGECLRSYVANHAFLTCMECNVTWLWCLYLFVLCTGGDDRSEFSDCSVSTSGCSSMAGNQDKDFQQEASRLAKSNLQKPDFGSSHIHKRGNSLLESFWYTHWPLQNITLRGLNDKF